MEERSVTLRCLDLDSAESVDSSAVATGLRSWLSRLSTGGPVIEGEHEVAVRGKEAFAARLSRSATAKPRKAGSLQMSSRGSLSNLRPVVQEDRRAPGPTEAELRIRAVGLNFRDVLNVMVFTLAIPDLQAPTAPAQC